MENINNAKLNTNEKNADISVQISDSYENTAELEQKFAIINKTPVVTEMEKKIQNRLLNGFENWNRGFDAWKAWGNILYTDDSIYNVHGARLTLAQYQAAMNIILRKCQLLMGDFHNMVICDNWTAIYYDISTNGVPGSVMEFVNFEDYGSELGSRVVEGWGGVKDAGYAGMAHFMGTEEKAYETEKNAELLEYMIPDTDNLSAKYPVMNPTTDHSKWAKEIRNAVLFYLDSCNKGLNAFSSCLDTLFTADATSTNAENKELTMEEYKEEMQAVQKQSRFTGLYFDSMLISGEWAAIHYPVVIENMASGNKTLGDRMQFLHFTEDNGSLKIDQIYTK